MVGESLVCGMCGHAGRSASDGVDAFESMADGIESTLALMKGTVRRGVFAALKARAWFILPLLVLLMLAIALSPSTPERYLVSALAFGIFPLTAPLILLVYLRLKRGRVPTANIRLLRSRIREQLEIARKHYGDDPEVQLLLGEYEAEVGLIRRARLQDHVNGAIGFALLLFLFVFSLWLVPPTTETAFDRMLEDVNGLRIAAVPVRAEVNGPLAPYLRIADGPVAIKHTVVRRAGRLDLEARPRLTVTKDWLGHQDPALPGSAFSLSLYVVDQHGMSLYDVPLQESYSDYARNPLLNDATEFNAYLTASINEADFAPGEWLTVVEALERAGATQQRFVIASTASEVIEEARPDAGADASEPAAPGQP